MIPIATFGSVLISFADISNHMGGLWLRNGPEVSFIQHRPCSVWNEIHAMRLSRNVQNVPATVESMG